MGSEWFASWFDSPHYRRLYAHRDDAEAAGFIDALVRRLALAAGCRVLDLGCGSGRHARQLAARGFDTTGIDLSAASIAEAVAQPRPGLRFERQDMRQPFGATAFDLVFNGFTSFGYFETAADHHRVMENIATSLKAGGRVVLDYVNVCHAERHLKPYELRIIDGVTYRISRRVDGRFLVKRIAVEAAGVMQAHVEKVARFRLADFVRLFAAHDLTVEDVFGDYALRRFDPVGSPRLILVARKPGGGSLARQLPADPADRLRRYAQV